MIKFILESNIPEFTGKTWREKVALRRLAIKNNNSILWMSAVYGGCLGLAIAFSVFAAEYISTEYLHCSINLFYFLAIVLFISIPSSYLFQWTVINPRMKKYFEGEKRKS